MGKRKATDLDGGIKFGKNVNLDAIVSLGDKPNKAFDEAMRSPAKIRITTMVDEDIYRELKQLSQMAGHGKYQTFLNDFLRLHLFPVENNRLVLEDKVKDLAAKIEKMTKAQKAFEKKVDTIIAVQQTKKAQ